ncbi:MAG: hypothetical protein IPH16_09765 [Haliscomenobacter sp.]|nr:hypothetical protein [Haliscomenobacter sp.]
MKNLWKLFLVAVLALSLAGCKDDAVEVQESEFNLLTTYMKTNNLDLTNLTGSFVIAGSGINVNTADFSVPDYYVLDIRSKADYDLGHIKNAVNVTLANVLEEAAKAGGKKILVVCYTGQTASRAVAALKLMGYDAKTLKWGMASWHADFAGKWTSNAVDFASPNWVTTGAAPAMPTFTTFPTLATGQTDPAKILESRVKTMLLNTAWMETRDNALANPGNYFVINYWPQVSWDAFGHINGAYRFMEDLKIDNLKNIDPAKTCLVYCYTGQTSGITSAWLEVMGYNTKSLGFGSNRIVYTQLKGSDVDKAKTKAWKGDGSGSGNNFGYYDAAGTLHAPVQ